SELTRVARLTTVGTMAASIAHEINQPLASIVMNGNAGLRWLARSEPNLEEARSAFGRIVHDGHGAAEIITCIRAMFRKESRERPPLGNKRTYLRCCCHFAWRAKESSRFARIGACRRPLASSS